MLREYKISQYCEITRALSRYTSITRHLIKRGLFEQMTKGFKKTHVILTSITHITIN